MPRDIIVLVLVALNRKKVREMFILLIIILPLIAISSIKTYAERGEDKSGTPGR